MNSNPSTNMAGIIIIISSNLTASILVVLLVLLQQPTLPCIACLLFWPFWLIIGIGKTRNRAFFHWYFGECAEFHKCHFIIIIIENQRHWWSSACVPSLFGREGKGRWCSSTFTLPKAQPFAVLHLKSCVLHLHKW